jgi:hypothetical protein
VGCRPGTIIHRYYVRPCSFKSRLVACCQIERFMRPQRVMFTSFIIIATVTNLYFYDYLGVNNQGTQSEKLGYQSHIQWSFVVCTFYNYNEVVFTVCFFTPAYLIGISLSLASFCIDGHEILKIEGEEQTCAEFQRLRVLRSILILFFTLIAHYLQ